MFKRFQTGSNESIYDNNDWQYIQFGGLNSHIDISNQVGADKVEHSNNLNETLGLYYIVKAVHENKITKGVADSLGKDFISKISIKNSFNKSLTNEIINLIVDKEKVYKLINELPFSNDARDYSINYIFDKDNNVIEIYYHKFNNTNLSKNINIFNSQSFDGNNSWEDFKSENYTLINWTKYAKRWEEFCLLWPSLSFNNSYIKLTNSNGPVINNNLSLMTNKINKSIPEYIAPPFNDPVVLNNDTFNFKFENNFWIFMAQNRIHIYLCIWHDDNNIYCQYAGHNSSQFCASGSSYDIKLDSITFHNLSDSSVLLNKKIANEKIYALVVDSQSNIFRTQEDRVYKLSTTGVETLIEGLDAGKTARNIVINNEDNVYVGTDSGSVYKSDGIHKFEKILLPDSTNWIWALAVNKKTGIVYVGNDDGVYSIDKNSNVNHMLGTHDYINSLAIGEDGSVFAGANNHGKIYKSNGVNDFQLIKEQNDAGSIKSLVVDTIGTIFAGSDNGNIYQINSGSMYSKILNTGHEIKRLIIDRDGVLFAGVDSNQIYKKVKKIIYFLQYVRNR
ncbi:MAG: PQQ-like beta-propeller repeat protein [Spiroplasma ixodetis]|nr:PQQ-like beta-propeller repeat protein [Spiroplasma ixodetis]MBP1528428.1 PQQ-like beta-propeller repeat protein [Spiroplasma ixodetis]